MTSKWEQLNQSAKAVKDRHLRELFAEDPSRAERFCAQACGLRIDYSKNRIDDASWAQLLRLAQASGVAARREKMFAGLDVNGTEGRAALHVALRRQDSTPFPEPATGGTGDVMPEVRSVLSRVASFSERVRSGAWRGFRDTPMTDVVNIGIGGSELGPLMVCDALRDHAKVRLRTHFVSNIDATHLGWTLDDLDPATTLFVIASKTFGTQETLANARTAREWIVNAGGEAAVEQHFIALSTSLERVTAFGIDPENMFPFWDWVGGRYSLWSAIGMSIALGLGFSQFAALHRGATSMDRHFCEAPLEHNLPVILGLLHVWYRAVFGAETRAVLPYDFALRHFPAYLQQLEMESLGKRVDQAGNRVGTGTGPVVWGGPGNNGQHAYYQLLHQGTLVVPADFIIPRRTQRRHPEHDRAVVANALAQMEALMLGRTIAEASRELKNLGEAREDLAPHKVMEGNRPSTAIVYERLDAETLGALIALYEHKVFVQSVLWDINPFDQFGVELGKRLSTAIEAELAGGAASAAHDSSTAALIGYLGERKPK